MEYQHYYLVTGASSGIGFATALVLAQNKRNKVIAIARNATKLESLRLASENKIDILPFDLEKGNLSDLVDDLKNMGVNQISGVIHNAGYLVSKKFGDISSLDLQKTYEVNVFAPFRLTQHLLPFLKQAKGAHVVNISSVGGIQGSVKFDGLSAYSSSKGALCILTECLANELRDERINVNCLALGAVQTAMWHQAFPGYEAPLNANEMGEFVAWFIENGSKFFNGKILPVALSTP
ncbi:MAG: SDR family NAD(P)-dependent oxidoreductase [Bacteroidia bacterium]